MMKSRISFNGLKVYLTFISLLFLISCKSETPGPVENVVATDYSIASHWLSIPATLSPVDIFYYYPSSWKKLNASDPIICEVDNPMMLQTAPVQFEKQATAFETVGNVYAPFYRQDDAASTVALPPAEQAKVVGGIPTTDATAAFDYYIKHFNNGRPFILVGHSQGAIVLSNLLSGYLKENPTVYQKMIAAYVIGWPISSEYLAQNPHLKFAEGPDDVGVIISYNTEAPNIPLVNPLLAGLIGVVINPITWTRDETIATTAQGLGSFMPDSTGVFRTVPQYADARVDIAKGVLICSTAGELDSLDGCPYGIYHTFDISFYYYNLRQNAANRAKIFLHK
jgi:pimeloyl-ACP methyl ester carboxylesterase